MKNLYVGTLPKFTTLTYINFTPQKYAHCCNWLGQVPQPWLASLYWLGHLPSLASLINKKKTSGTEVRRTLDVRFVDFKRFVGFNFDHVQLLRYIVVMVWSS